MFSNKAHKSTYFGAVLRAKIKKKGTRNRLLESNRFFIDFLQCMVLLGQACVCSECIAEHIYMECGYIAILAQAVMMLYVDSIICRI